MELRALRYFVAVADAGSVTGGAADVRVSQPAVSRQIKGLERELGVELLVRFDGGVRLTAAGAELLTLARDLLERAAFLSRTAASLAAGRLVSLTIAAPATTLSDVIAPFIADLPNDGPATPTIDVVARAGSDAFDALAEGADLVVAPVMPPPGVASMFIADLPVRAYSAGPQQDSSHPTMALAELADAHPLVTLPAHYPVRQVLDRAFADEGLAPQHVQEVESPEAAQALAASGRGVAVLTNDARFGLTPSRIVDTAGQVLTLPLHAAWPPRHHAADELAATARALHAFCLRQYEGELAD